MKRFIVLHEDGSLGVNTTSGQRPPNWLCDCHDEWVLDELTYSDGIVFVDPEKIRRKKMSLAEKKRLDDYAAFQITVTRAKAKFKKYWWIALVVVSLIAGYYLLPHVVTRTNLAP